MGSISETTFGPGQYFLLEPLKGDRCAPPVCKIPDVCKVRIGTGAVGPCRVRYRIKKTLHGHPLAAIRIAWPVLGAVRNDVIPHEARQKLEYLLTLYQEPTAPPVKRRLRSRLPPSPSSHGNSEAGGGNGKTGRRPSDTKRRRPRAVQ